MKRSSVIFAAIVLSALCSSSAHAQMGGLDFFKKSGISAMFHPVVGAGSVYQSTGKDSGTTHDIEMVVVGKESVGAADGYWLEIGFGEGKQQGYSKVLISKDDLQPHKIIFQMNGMPAMEMPFNPDSAESKRMKDEMSNWSQVGTETITVPAGTFSCTHWKKSDGTNEIWASDKVTPFGMVKSVDAKASTMVLVRQITDAKDHITGPVRPFDPQALGQLMQQQHQQPH
jgi:hypothetical protein